MGCSLISKPARFVRKPMLGVRFFDCNEVRIDVHTAETAAIKRTANTNCPTKRRARISRKKAGMKLAAEICWFGAGSDDISYRSPRLVNLWGTPVKHVPTEDFA